MNENFFNVKGAIEAMLFVAAEPIPIEALRELFSLTEIEAISLLEQMKSERDAEKSGIILRRVDNGYQFCTNPEYSEYINMLLGPQRRQQLSQAALETLSIVAYKQPVTRGEIENIRGVKSSAVVTMLLEKGLIEKVGTRKTLGHPALLGTTKEFLMHFGLEKIQDLPSIEQLQAPAKQEI